MGDIKITIDGLSAVLAALERVKAKIVDATRNATQESGERLQSDARRNFSGAHAPGFWHVGGDQPNTVTGRLQASIRFLTPTIQQGPATFSNRSGPTAIYSRVIELGAHITPKEARLLSWFDAQFQVQRYMKSVDIPPRPYFTPARMKLPPRMETIFYSAWKQAYQVG